MRNATLLVLFVALIIKGYGQAVFKPLVKEETIGYTKDRKPIKAKHYTFNRRLEKVLADSANEKLVLIFREQQCCPLYIHSNGVIHVYHKAADSLIWSCPINFKKQECYVYNSILFVTAYDTTLAYHLGQQKILWKKPVTFAYYHFETSVFLGFETGSDKQSTTRFVGLDVETGEEKWHQIIDPTLAYWKETILSDSVLATISDSLYVRKLTDGTGWSYPILTYQKMSYETPAYIRKWALEQKSFYNQFIRDDKEIAHELHSELLSDSTFLYLATANEVVKLRQKTGEVVWKVPLPENLASTSRLVLRDSVLWMINYGTAYFRASERLVGKPFLAKINRETGKLYFSWNLARRRKEIIGYDFRKEHLILYCPGQVQVVSYQTGDLVKRKRIRKKYGMYARQLHLPSYFFSKDSLQYKPYSQKYEDGAMLTHGGRDAIILDKNLKVAERFKWDDSNREIMGLREASILKTPNEYVLLDTTGTRFGAIKRSLKSKNYENGQFYLYGSHEIFEFGWNDLLPGSKGKIRYMWPITYLIKTFGF